MTKRHITIATRESPLALQQAEIIRQLLLQHHPQLSVELLGMTTQADRHLDVELIEIGGKGLFVKELEEALLDGRADIAVHSMKDVPMELPPGLCLTVVTTREEPRDAFVANDYASLAQLPRGARVGTSSLRRQTQLRALRPDVEWCSLRGNIHTRLKKLDHGDFQAIILAAAGLQRMQLQSRIRSYLAVEDCLPAAGQGALGIECCTEEAALRELLAPLNDAKTTACVLAERALCRHLGGGCRLPVAAYAKLQQGELYLRGLVADRYGRQIIRAEHSGHPAHAEQIGLRVAQELLQKGAAQLLQV